MNFKVEAFLDGLKHGQWILSIGTHSVGADLGRTIPLQFPTVSRLHAELSFDGENVFVRSLGRNGAQFTPSGSRLKKEINTSWPQSEHLELGPFELRWSHYHLDNNAALTLDELRSWARVYESILLQSPSDSQLLFQKKLESTPHAEAVFKLVLDEFHGDGPLTTFLNDQSCREILINRYDQIFIDSGDGLYRCKNEFLIPNSVLSWATRTAQKSGRRLDLQHPICDATLPDGARFHAVRDPIANGSVSISIRRFGAAPISIEDALSKGWVAPEAMQLVSQFVREKKNIVISGGTSSGKTSLLNLLCNFFDTNERIITVEDTLELKPNVENLVQLQARVANTEGVGAVSMRQLVQCALRMRPDRIIVGECRGPEVIDMLQALNTGHPGSITTVHSNSPHEAFQRLELLALLGAGNLSLEGIRQWIRSSIDCVIQVERLDSGNRILGAIMEKKQNESKIVYCHPESRTARLEVSFRN